MAQLLHIDASPRGERSHSRRMTREFVQQSQQSHPNDAIAYRDVGRNPIPHVYEAWIAAAFSSPEQYTPRLQEAIRLSDQLVDEFLAADIYVIGVPMYNFSVPSGFKAYIDQIVRIGRTVDIESNESGNVYTPLVLDKKMYIIEARGDSGFQPSGRYEAMNHHDPYLATVFEFMGITDITFVHVENDESGGQTLAESIANARHKIAELVAA
ncbi:FMN-dependent NADH-azoreductase 2 [Leptolyngbya boryana NIES-2135]|jgi:FMN-dependent NADH-azoreductase|uniref:FMN dependent NADH:quinone oxidoreductase n=1 Tax=Leptolyngbya boryana NIES-2135 TaxID=1973484 RepID=A0A1Z4JAW7_LEPBY|nr:MULTISPECIES: FMN-dependent NADH-azoreductase [Leptolyngbya]BAY53919.1 FMN-dependent NADH-azoreductase 2 [Leptolyngbya boryana NIES-2135]MBD2371484.1 FMN-dependent NADH-azoreductase [Leptolyngbya sp. FACHB-161]MBD2377996.1 FMN-dependent NADH-azoreductase [Leptolyngbya sp. FACHB-238]MBD2402431.1 FMN-dependent NADH-azoreductase [Leptolyngbya sp. FACHB-239]MBD2408915.1 FMN-dependent NADH-azoreductase [Leptolyngbya sp. FACHB-402]